MKANRVITILVLGILLIGFSQVAFAQDWVPKDAIKIIVPFNPGGGSDTRARLICSYWQKYLPGDKPIVIINKPGGGGVLGLTEVFHAKPDGLTLVIMDTVGMVLNELTADVQFKTLDFEPIGQTNAYTRVLITNPKTIPDGSSWQKVVDKIYDYRIATVGFGTTPHMAVVAIGQVGEFYDPFKLKLVHYDGTGASIAGFQRGEIDIMIGAVESHSSYVADGLMKFNMVFADERHFMCPDVPTSIEEGLNKVEQINAITYGNSVIFAPPKTPENVLSVLRDSLEQAMKDPELIQKGLDAKNPLVWLSAERCGEIIQNLFDLWSTQEEALQIFKGQ